MRARNAANVGNGGGAWWEGPQMKNHLLASMAFRNTVFKYIWGNVGGMFRVMMDLTGSPLEPLLGSLQGTGSNKKAASQQLVRSACIALERAGMLVRGRRPGPAEQRLMSLADKLRNKGKGKFQSVQSGSGGGGGGGGGGSGKLGKAIRQAAITGDANQALVALRNCLHRGLVLDDKTAEALLRSLIMGNMIPLPPEVGGVLEAMTNKKHGHKNLNHATAFLLLALIPQRCSPAEGCKLVEQLLMATDFANPTAPFADPYRIDPTVCKAYAIKQCKLLMLEHLEEAKSTRERAASRDVSYSRNSSSVGNVSTVPNPFGMKKGRKLDVAFDVSESRDSYRRGFVQGDSVAISLMTDSPPRFAEADITGVQSGVIMVKFRSQFEWHALERESKGRRYPYRVDAMGNRITHQRILSAIKDLTHPPLDKEQRLSAAASALPHSMLARAILTPVEYGEQGKVPDICNMIVPPVYHQRMMQKMLREETLNNSQLAAVRAALLQRITLIQGPPGTGKTHVSVTVMTILAKLNYKVLAVAGTNIAADNLVLGLAKRNVDVVRLGKVDKVNPEVEPYAIDRMDFGHTDHTELFQERQKRLKQARVVCTTCAGSGSPSLTSLRFRFVLCDEASQITEPENLIPLCKGAQQLTLVGDQCQLPPTVSSQEAEALGLSTPLFINLLRKGVQPQMLDTQYRMHPSISEFPGDMVYGGLLLDGISKGDRPVPSEFPWPNPNVPVALYPVRGMEYRDNLSYYNEAEADKALWVVRKLRKAGFSSSEIGVIAPYAAQVRCLKKMMGSYSEIEISSVDGFQGREKEAIVFTATRSNQGGSVGFLRDWRRVNVMLTRARRCLVVVGCIETLSGEQSTWAHWIHWARSMGVIVGDSRKAEYDKKLVQSYGLTRLTNESKRMGSAMGSGVGVSTINGSYSTFITNIPPIPVSSNAGGWTTIPTNESIDGGRFGVLSESKQKNQGRVEVRDPVLTAKGVVGVQGGGNMLYKRDKGQVGNMNEGGYKRRFNEKRKRKRSPSDSRSPPNRGRNRGRRYHNRDRDRWRRPRKSERKRRDYDSDSQSDGVNGMDNGKKDRKKSNKYRGRSRGRRRSYSSDSERKSDDFRRERSLSRNRGRGRDRWRGRSRSSSRSNGRRRR